MLKAIEVIIEPSGTIRLLETLHVTTPTRAILTLLEPQLQPGLIEKGSNTAILQFLQNNPLEPEYRRTAAEIDQQISEERLAWE